MSWLTPALLLVALLLGYYPTLARVAAQWSGDADMGHGFVVPVVAVWAAWRGRAKIAALQLRPSGWGIAVVAAAGVLLYLAEIGAGLFLASVAFVLALAGVVLGLGGFPLLRGLAFPLALLLFMLPKLAVVYNQVTLPLQLVASRLAELALSAAGVQVSRNGNILALGSLELTVAEACNGIRYLLSLGFLAVVYAW